MQYKKQRSSHSTKKNRGLHTAQETQVLTQHNNRGPHTPKKKKTEVFTQHKKHKSSHSTITEVLTHQKKKNRGLHTAQETQVLTQHNNRGPHTPKKKKKQRSSHSTRNRGLHTAQINLLKKEKETKIQISCFIQVFFLYRPKTFIIMNNSVVYHFSSSKLLVAFYQNALKLSLLQQL